MKPIPIISLSSKRKGRNQKISLFNKKYFQNDKAKTISSTIRPPTTSRIKEKIPILSFPLEINNKRECNESSSPLFLTSRNFNNHPLSPKKKGFFKTIISYKNKPRISVDNKYRKIISEGTLNKQFIDSKTIENKIKESKKSQRLKKINILDFGNNLKLYDEIEQKNKEKTILEKRARQLDEIYYDYDKSNTKHIMNSFSGNSPDLLKNKVCFVKGIMDFLYPKLVLQKMEVLNEMKVKQYKEGKKYLQHNNKNEEYYISKFRNPEQNAAMSKYLFGGDLEIVRQKDNSFRAKKILINKCKVSKLMKNYDYI